MFYVFNDGDAMHIVPMSGARLVRDAKGTRIILSFSVGSIRVDADTLEVRTAEEVAGYLAER